MAENSEQSATGNAGQGPDIDKDGKLITLLNVIAPVKHLLVTSILVPMTDDEQILYNNATAELFNHMESPKFSQESTVALLEEIHDRSVDIALMKKLVDGPRQSPACRNARPLGRY
jgi:hypothetical protein